MTSRPPSRGESRLGRGLAGMVGTPETEPQPVVIAGSTSDGTGLMEVAVDALDRNPFQPRKDFAPDALRELADSIRRHGMLQALLVRPHGERFQLIAGERRWLAARKAGLTTVPCQVRQFSDRQMFESALEENIKREDLNPLEKAEAFRGYLERFDSTIEQLAERLSLARSTVSNFLRLVDLPDAIKQALRQGRMSGGHARALLTLDELDALALCGRVIAEGLSVRQTETAARQLRDGSETVLPDEEVKTPRRREPVEPTAHVLALQEQLRAQFGVEVEIRLSSSVAGKVIIPFASNEEFERFYRVICRRAA